MSEPVPDDDGLLAYANFRFDGSHSAASPATAAASFVAATSSGTTNSTTAPTTPTYLQQQQNVIQRGVHKSNMGTPMGLSMSQEMSHGMSQSMSQSIAYPYSQQPLTQIPEYGQLQSQSIASAMGPLPQDGFVNVQQQQHIQSQHHLQQQHHSYQMQDMIQGPQPQQSVQQQLGHHPLPLPSPPPNHQQQFIPSHHHTLSLNSQLSQTSLQQQPIQQQQQQQQLSQPFSYIPTIAATVPVHGGKTRQRGPRRRRTGSKRSLEEMILESTIPTSITTDLQMPQRTGLQIGLITGVDSAATGLMSPSMMATAAPTLPLTLPEPPLATAMPTNPTAMNSDSQPRPKKKSKYSAEQDNIILQMKREGKSWSDIAEAANCGNALAARNRYQVLIGQQGGGSMAWETEDAVGLKMLLEKGEKAKWDYIATEISRMRSKNFTAVDCQGVIKQLFDENPAFFGIIVGPSAPPPQQLQVLPQAPAPYPFPMPNSYMSQSNELDLMGAASYGNPHSDFTLRK